MHMYKGTFMVSAERKQYLISVLVVLPAGDSREMLVAGSRGTRYFGKCI
jgi:hypothetical protein